MQSAPTALRLPQVEWNINRSALVQPHRRLGNVILLCTSNDTTRKCNACSYSKSSVNSSADRRRGYCFDVVRQSGVRPHEILSDLVRSTTPTFTYDFQYINMAGCFGV